MSSPLISRRLILAGIAGTIGGLAGCSNNRPNPGPTPTPTPSPNGLAGLGKTVDITKSPMSVTELYTDGNPLRLPINDKQPYGAFLRSKAELLTGDGKRWPVDQKIIDRLEGASYGNLVYQAELTANKVTKLTAVAEVTNAAILTSMFGGKVMVGKISPTATRGSQPSYESAATLPVAVQLAPAAETNGALKGTIVNAERDATVDGQKFPSLKTAKQKNPLISGYTADIQIQRSPGMHLPFEDELVFAWTDSSSGMGSEFYPSLATLFGDDPIGNQWSVSQHGVPSSGPSLQLSLAKSSAVN